METFSDLDDLFGRNPITNDVIADFDEQSIKNSIRGLILTRPMERPFLPRVGCDVKNYLFNNYTSSTPYEIKRSIIQAISNFEPRVVLDDVLVNIDNIDNNSITVNIYYRIVTDPNNDRSLTLRLN